MERESAAVNGRLTSWRRLAALCVVSLAAVLWVLGASSRASAADAIFPGSCPAYGDEQICSGEVPSFDGTPLDVDLTKPAQNTGTTHPLIVMLHGFGNNKHEWESLTNQGDGGDKYNWNSHWFSQHGYYVLTYTARGFIDTHPGSGYQPPTPGGSSTGSPEGQIHLKSRDTEVKDTQWLAALVAYSFPDVDPNRVAVSGGSYGGGESWTQASQPQWTFPNHQDPSLPVLQLQVAVPKYPWTDLAYSLAPNGHPGPWPLESAEQPPSAVQPPEGYCDVDQSLSDDPCYSSSQGHPESDSGSGNPFGVVKFSYTQLFFSWGHAASDSGTLGGGFQRDDPCDGPAASIDDWYATAVVAGEPYSSAPGVDSGNGPQIRRGLTECRSAYYQDEGWKAQASGPRRVAVFSIQGWTDDLFTPVESFRQFKYLKSLDPNWPVEVALADIGHPRAKNEPDTWHYLNQQAWQWLQSNINASHDRQTNIASLQTVCDNGAGAENPNDPNQNITATSPEALSNGKISITYGHGGATTSDTPDPNGAGDDPITNAVSSQVIPGSANCPPSLGPAPYTAVSAPLTKDRVYVGLGSVTVPYMLTGTTAQLDARVWDVPPGPAENQAGGPQCRHSPIPQGCPVLITRGTYRLDVQGGYDSPKGQIRIPLFGNQYDFKVGHKIRLDLTQQDTPYLRMQTPTLLSSIVFDSPPTLTLPTRQSGTTELAGP
jgi:dienelactone hydrolase